MTGFFDYFNNFSLNEKIFACALYKDADKLFNENPFWRGVGNLRISGLLSELNLGEDIMRNAQLSKSIWDNMTEENKKQLVYSFMDMIDIVSHRLEDENYVQLLNRSGLSKESVYEMMSTKLGFLIGDIFRLFGGRVIVDVKKRWVFV